MAKEEHQQLAQFIKDVHSTLRQSSLKGGPAKAWLEHCENEATLITYAQYMEKLATTYWDANSKTNAVVSRIMWTADFCYDYFINKTYLKHRKKDIDIASKIDESVIDEKFSSIIRLLDVGSCYNPFRKFNYFNVLAVDLCPANDTVVKCDFINVDIGWKTEILNGKVVQLSNFSFDAVSFCFLLEYIPDTTMRMKACQNAYSVLKPGGILIINTPDSKHVGANSKIMKCWRYALACIGFSRIKYEKFKHMHCMAFRKSINKEIPIRWAKLHKEPYMKEAIHIPQDFSVLATETTPISEKSIEIVNDLHNFQELPFSFMI